MDVLKWGVRGRVGGLHLPDETIIFSHIISPPVIIYSLKSFFKIGFVTIQISPTKIGSATAEQLIELQKSPADEFGVKHIIIDSYVYCCQERSPK